MRLLVLTGTVSFKSAFGILLLVSVLLFLSPVLAQEPKPSVAVEQACGAAAFKAGEVLVKFTEDVSEASIRRLLVTKSMGVLSETQGLGIVRLAVPVGRELDKVEELKHEPLVEYAEPNYVVHTVAAYEGLDRSDQPSGAGIGASTTCSPVIPDDPRFPDQWNLNRIQAPAAWCITTGSEEVVIAIVNTGVDLDHPELGAKIWTNPGEIPGNGFDDDGNGYIDDARGWDFVNGDDDPDDDYGFGTFVATVAAAEANNSFGIAGISWGARIMAVKVLNAEGRGYSDDLVEGIVYAADKEAKIIDLSLSTCDYSEALQDAVTYAYSKGCLLVAAAGDCGGGVCCDVINPVMYPAACEHVLAVAGITRNDERLLVSGYGPYIDIAAPGEDIPGYWGTSYSDALDSTMVASPHVSGLAALIWSVSPTLTPDEVENIIGGTAVDLGDPGRDDYFGHGCIDANAAVTATPHYLQVSPSWLLFLADAETEPPCQRVSNAGTGPSTWSASASAPWLSIAEPFGYTPSWITVCADKDALPDYGTYTAKITAMSTMANCVNDPQIITATLSYVPQLFRFYFPLCFKGYKGP